MLRDVFGLLRATRKLGIAGEKWEIGGDPADLKALNTVKCSDTQSSVTAREPRFWATTAVTSVLDGKGI